MPEEIPVALVLNGVTAAVLMATPEDLEDFLLGFCVSEGIVQSPDEISDIEIIAHPNGQEVRGSVPADRAAQIAARRRTAAGPVGCGLCGIESLEAASPPLPVLPDGSYFPDDWIKATFQDMRAEQELGNKYGSMHVAGFCHRGGLIAVREDVGRHNALDKLLGAVHPDMIHMGAVYLSSRVSIDLVQKCIRAGVRTLYALGRPTRAAADLAGKSNLRLGTVMGDSITYYHGEPPQDEETPK